MSRTSCSKEPTRKFLSAVVATTFMVTLGLLGPMSCGSPTDEIDSVLGKIEITAMSQGAAPQPDSLVVLLNGDVSGTMGPNGTYTIPFLPPGEYLVALRDEWEGCWMGVNERKVTVEPRETTPTTFLVRCR